MTFRLPSPFEPGYELQSGPELNYAFGNPTWSTENGIIAKAGGSRNLATQLNAVINRIDVCVSNGDSVKLPKVLPGKIVIVFNNGISNCTIFAFENTTTINGSTAGFVLNSGSSVIFISVNVNQWNSFSESEGGSTEITINTTPIIGGSNGNFLYDNNGVVGETTAVTEIIAGTGLTGGTITGNGTIALEPSGAGPGSFSNADVTLDALGRITSISSGGNSPGFFNALDFGAVNDGRTNNQQFITNWNGQGSTAAGNTLTKSLPIAAQSIVPNPWALIVQAANIATNTPVTVPIFFGLNQGGGSTPSNVPVGSTVVILVTAWLNANQAITSVTDSVGNTYTQIVQSTATSNVGSAAVFWCQSTTHQINSQDTFTVNAGGSGQTYGMLAFYIVGGASAANFSTSTTGTGTTFSLSTGTLSANSLVLAFSYPWQTTPPRATFAAGFNQYDTYAWGGGFNWAFQASGSGLTFNAPAFSSAGYAGLMVAFTVPSLTPTCPALLTMGNISGNPLPGPGFRLNESFQLSTFGGGSLPSGMDTSTIYHATHVDFTAHQCQFSETNGGSQFGTEGAPVTCSAAATAPVSVILCDAEWTNLVFPPGSYDFNSGGGPGGSIGIGERFLNVQGYGADVQGIFNVVTNLGACWTGESNAWAQIQTATSGPAQGTGGTTTLQMLNLTNATFFFPNHWMQVVALDVEGGANFNPDNYYIGYVRIDDYDPATGRVFLLNGNQLDDTYRSSCPTYLPDLDGNYSLGYWQSPQTRGPPLLNGGAATIYWLPPYWDTEVLMEGFHSSTPPSTQAVLLCRKATLRNMTIDGQPPAAGFINELVFDNCNFTNLFEIDKGAASTTLLNCNAPAMVTQAYSSGSKRVVYDGGKYGSCQFGNRQTLLRNATFQEVFLGALYGQLSICKIEGCEIQYFGGGGFFNVGNLVNCFSFNAGTLQFPWIQGGGSIVGGVANWAVPGAKLYVTDSSSIPNLGSPFAITDIYVSNDLLCIDTTLPALPVGPSTSSTVTITAGSPAVVTWNGPAAVPDDNTPLQLMGNLPQSLLAFNEPFGTNTYYPMSVSGSTFNLSTTKGGGGSAINTTAYSDNYALAVATFKGSGGTIGTPVLFVNTIFAQANNGALVLPSTPVPAGSLLVVEVILLTADLALDPVALTDSAGNTYTLAVASTPTAGVYSTGIYYCSNCNRLPQGSWLKYQTTGTASTLSIYGSYVANANGGLDQTASVVLTASNISSLTASTSTLAQSNEIAFASWTAPQGVRFGGVNQTYANPSGWASLTEFMRWHLNGQPIVCSDFSYKVVSATTAITYNPTAEIWAIANQLFFISHPCPQFTASANRGCPQIKDLSGAIDEPLFSRFKRTFSGASSNVPFPTIWGTLDVLTINVIQAAAGASIVLSAKGSDSSLVSGSSNLSATIDCSVAGIRTITTSSATTSMEQGSDSFSPYTGWINEGVEFVCSWGPTTPLTSRPVVEITCKTNQGVTNIDNVTVFGLNDTTGTLIGDSTINDAKIPGP